MNRLGLVVTVVVAVAMVSSAMAFPLLGGGFATADNDAAGGEVVSGGEGGDGHPPGVERDVPAEELTAIPMGATTQAQDEPAAEYEDAVEDGVDEGINVVQAQGVEVTQEQRAAALEGALESVTQHQEADVEQVQKATAGAVHGTLVQDQDVEVEQVQAAVGGATDGTLAQYQTVNATQMQHASWGATHGAIAQKQVVTVEQLQVATQGAAAGAAFKAGEKDVAKPGKIQEAAQGAAYGVVSQYQKITVEQRQQVTLEHVQHAAAGASAGALEGAQEQRVEVEQYQAVTIKQVQKAAKGAAKGALVQRQEVTVEQTQAAARGAAKGPLEKVQEVRIEQVQRVTITQIQEASFGAAKGAIYQSQEATVEQIQAAAVGSSGGVLVQKQEVSITQIQKAAFGSSKGAVVGAIQHQVVEVEQIQAAAFGAGEGAVIQKQAVDVTQVQVLAEGASSGVLAQAQVATAEQLQVAARGACEASAQVIQYQRVSVTQVQILVSATAADATDYAVDAEIDLEDLEEVLAFALEDAGERAEEIDELEGEATVTFADQDSDGETVVVEDVTLSEGGFLAIHDEAFFEGEVDSVRGVSEYLEPGDHEEVEIDLEEPITEERTLSAVAHLDTTGDEEFTYVETGGEEDVPYVDLGGSPIYDEAVVAIEDPDVIDSAPEAEGALEVTDYEIDADPDEEYVTFENVVDAPLEMTGWTVEDDEQAGENEPYTFPDGFILEPDAEVTLVTGEGEDTNETLYRGLEQPVWDETGDTVIVSDAAGEVLLEHELEPEVPDLEATLTVSDQEGDGETLVVDEASAPEEYVVAVLDEEGEEIGESEVFDAEQVVEDLEIALDPPLETDATLDVEVRSAEDDEVLASATITYALEDVPVASVAFEDQDSDGTAVTVDSADVPDGGFVAVYEEDVLPEGVVFDDLEPEDVDPEAVIGVSEYLEAGEYEDLEIDLFDVPGLEFEAEETLEEDEQSLIAIAHEDTGETETFEFVETDSEDDVPYVDGDGTAVADEALVTVEPDVLEPEVEFLSCTEAEVTGDVEGIGYVQEFYLEEGFANQVAAPQFPWDELADGENATIVRIGPEADAWIEDDGTRIVQIEDEGAFPSTETETSSILRAIELPGDEDSPEDEGTFGPLVENPEGDDCLDEVRPDLPDLSVEEIEPTDDGIDVTFGYDNPNEATITAPAEFEGTTDAEPPADLEPGMETFTVEWTPEDDEQLVWSVDMTGHGYDEPLSVSTPTAGEIAPTDPAAFATEIVETNAPIELGETLEVETTVENVGGEAGTQELELSLDGTTVDTAEVSLEAGEVGSVTLSTVIDEPGEYDLEVASDDDSDGTTITVDAPAILAVTDLSAPGSAQVGETLEVSATIENEGDLEGTGTVTYSVDGSVIDETSVTLASGESATISFTYVVPYELAGVASSHEVSTDDDSATVSIDVEPPEEPDPPEQPEPPEPPEPPGLPGDRLAAITG